METSKSCFLRFCILVLTIAAISFTHCDARRSMRQFKRPTHPRTSIIKTMKKLKVTKHLGIDPSLDPSNVMPYSLSSPFSLPPFESLGPMPLPENTPPFCLNPPNTPQPPSTTIPLTPIGGVTLSSPPPPPTISYLPPVLPIQSPPPSPTGSIPGPPVIFPSPPSYIPGTPEVVPSPTIYAPSPPATTLSPPYYEPSPPSYVPSPTGFVPSPPVFLPPVVYPPPTGPPSPKTAPNIALWCVAKPTVPDPIIQEAMDYACWSGADCDSVMPTGSCFAPNTLFAHASYAFNSYWQRTKVAGGTCDFGGTGMLVTVDPSYDGCHFVFV